MYGSALVLLVLLHCAPWASAQVLTIGFTETLYTETENQGSEVVVTAAVLSGPISREVDVAFTSPRVDIAIGRFEFVDIGSYATLTVPYSSGYKFHYFSEGFIIGTEREKYIYVSEDGYYSIGAQPDRNNPPDTLGNGSDSTIVAPYAADIDSFRGTARVAGFDMFSSSSHEIMKVNQYIRDETGVDFNGTRMMVTEWNGVASDSSNLSPTSTFQGILITDGVLRSYAVFIYECGGMGWGGATIGWQSGQLYNSHSLSGSVHSNDIGCLYSFFYSAVIFRLDANELGFATRLLTFSPNITTIDFPVPINKKFILETEIEPFMVGLDVATTGLNLVIEPAEATIQLYVIGFNPITYTVTEGIDSTASLTVLRTAAVNKTDNVTVLIQGALNDPPILGNVVFLPWEKKKAFEVNITDDSILEYSEVLRVSLLRNEGLVLDRHSSIADITILDNEVVTIGFTETLYTVTENEGSEVVVTAAVLSGPITETVTVHFRPRVANESGHLQFLEFLPFGTLDLYYFDYGIIYILDGFPFGQWRVDRVYVTSNGYFSMGSLSRYYSPPDLSVTGSDYNIVAPYAANYRLESFNSVSYTNFDTFSNTSNETVRVSKFIRDQTGVNFYGIKMMVAEWTNVSLSYSSDSSTNSFQGILITDGVLRSYAVFIYECGGMGFGGATIGWKATPSTLYSYYYGTHSLSGSAHSNDIGCLYSSTYSAVIYRLDANEHDLRPMLLSFTQSLTSIEVSVPVLELDSDIKPFLVGLELVTTGLNVLLEPMNATVYIPGVGFHRTLYTLYEGTDSVVRLRILRNGYLNLTTNVTFMTMPVTANESDFMQVVGNRVFLPGEKTMEVHITIADDITVEYSEIFTMTLLSEDSHVMSNSKQVEFTIIDNDVLTIGFTETLYTVTENNGSLVIVTAALLSGITVEEIVVKVAVPQYNSAGHLDFVDFGSLYTYSLDDDYFDYDLVATTDPIIFWTESITRIYVTTDGYFSIGGSPYFEDRRVTPYYEHNIDTRDQGTVRYAISGSSNEIMRVSHFIQDETGVNFYGRTMIVAEWNRVPRDLSSGNTSTFQGILITDGDLRSYAVFIYECGGMGWGGATIGWQGNQLSSTHSLSGSAHSNDIGCLYSSTYSAVIFQLDSSEDIINGRLLTFGPLITTVDLPLSMNDRIALKYGNESLQFGLVVVTTGLNVVTDPPIDLEINAIGFSYTSYTVSEVADFVRMAIFRSGHLNTATYVTIMTVPGTADELDYVPVNQNVAFQPGEEYKTIEVPIIDDTLLESNETFTIELVSDKAYVLANTSTSEVTIIENEFLKIGFTDSVYTVTENEESVLVVTAAVLSGHIAQEVVVNLTSPHVIKATGSIQFVELHSSSLLYDSFDSRYTYLREGFIFGAERVNYIYVTTNGYFSMGTSRTFSAPPDLSGEGFYTIVAPYAANIDTRTQGSVKYTDFDTFSSNDYEMVRISQFIRNETGVDFYGTKMIVAEWNDVQRYQYSDTKTSTFQGILITDGVLCSYAVFIYECGGMGWGGATIGWQANQLRGTHSLSGSAHSNDIGCLYSSTYSAVIFRLDASGQGLNGRLLTFGPSITMINVPIITNDDIESFAVGLELIDISLNILLDPAESEVQVLISKFDGPLSFVTLHSSSSLSEDYDYVTSVHFPFGTEIISVIYVSSSGYFSMGKSPTSSVSIPGTNFIVAPYAAVTDLSLAGTVTYTQFTSNDYLQMSHISKFIRSKTGRYFSGNRMMVAEWDGVAKSGGVSYITNSFQGILITDGKVSHAVFIYECVGMEWGGAIIGWQYNSSLYEKHSLSGSNSDDVGCLNFSSYSAHVYRLDASRLCEGGGFLCSNGQCIPQSYSCDGYLDCDDNSDEELQYCDSGDNGDGGGDGGNGGNTGDSTGGEGILIPVFVSLLCFVCCCTIGGFFCYCCYRRKRRKQPYPVHQPSAVNNVARLSSVPYPRQPQRVDLETEIQQSDNWLGSQTAPHQMTSFQPYPPRVHFQSDIEGSDDSQAAPPTYDAATAFPALPSAPPISQPSTMTLPEPSAHSNEEAISQNSPPAPPLPAEGEHQALATLPSAPSLPPDEDGTNTDDLPPPYPQ